jgi:riboflavin kinase / FMN adenylyltransferase
MHVLTKANEGIIRKPSGVVLGNFDGVHIGHRMLIENLIYQCKVEGLYSLLYTFNTHPHHVLRKNIMNYLLLMNHKKIEILSATGLDGVYFENFDASFSQLSPEVFVKEVLVERFGVKLVVVGENYRFGHKGSGDIRLLKELGNMLGFKVQGLPLLHLGEEIVSSTNIRQNLHLGNLEKVFSLLGRYFSIRAIVQHGDKIGRKLGYPTANILPSDSLALPKTGVYITKTLVGEKYHNSITNIGYNPTIADNKRISVETHIFDFNQDIYGKEIEVQFLSRVRGEIKFAGLEQLKEQMRLDCLFARENFIVK